MQQQHGHYTFETKVTYEGPIYQLNTINDTTIEISSICGKGKILYSYPSLKQIGVWKEEPITPSTQFAPYKHSNCAEVISTSKNDLKWWSTSTLEWVDTLSGHTKEVLCFTELSNGDLVSSGEDHALRLWRKQNGKFICVQTLNKSEVESYIFLLAVNNHLIACGKNEESKEVYHLFTLNPQVEEALRFERSLSFEGVAYSICQLKKNEKKYILIGSCSGTVHVIDPINFTLFKTFKTQGDVVKKIVEMSTGEIMILSFENDSFISVYNDKFEKVDMITNECGVVGSAIEMNKVILTAGYDTFRKYVRK